MARVGRPNRALLSAAALAAVFALVFSVRAVPLPEYFVQAHDDSLIAPGVLQWLVHGAGYASAVALCALLAAAAVLLSAVRAHARGATQWQTLAAAGIVALCLLGRPGVLLDPIGWFFAAAVLLLLESRDTRAAFAGIGCIVLWELLQGGATLGAVFAIVAAAGKILDTQSIRKNAGAIALAAICTLFSLLQLHAVPWHVYGAHALYLDSLLAAAPRDRVWSTTGASIGEAGFVLIVAVSAFRGIARRSAADALLFFVMLLVTLVDARNLPYFAIAAAPAVLAKTVTYDWSGVTRAALPAVAGACGILVFCSIAGSYGAQSRDRRWLAPEGAPIALLQVLAQDGRTHTVLCLDPRWCDVAQSVSPRLRALLDDRAGSEGSRARATQLRAEALLPGLRGRLRAADVDAVISLDTDAIAPALEREGWRAAARDGSRVLLKTQVLQ